MTDAALDKRILDYEQTLETYRQLADIRFKLLALVPALSGVAVALLTSSDLDRTEQVALSVLGFFVLLGVVVYDQRNSQFYNGAIGRAQFLETKLELPPAGGDAEGGLFRSRRGHPQLHCLLVPVSHGHGLALIYSPVFGAWVFAGTHAAWPGSPWVAVIAGISITALALMELLRLDGYGGRRWSRGRQRSAEAADDTAPHDGA